MQLAIMIGKAQRLVAFALIAGLGGCAANAPATPPGSAEIRQGVIEQITPADITSSHHRGVGAVVGGIAHHTGAGAVVGGLAGLGIGSLIGNGNGRDVAMVLGAVGGAVAGNEVQKKYDQPTSGQQVIVRTSSGVLVSVLQPTDPGLRPGQPVYIVGNGEDARVTAR
ncbi:MAG: glycine zipper 2TM domain-containing protein [Variovorax sp.]